MNTVDANLSPNIHHGRNIKRLREILGVKQEYIARELDITQQLVSKLEQKEVVEDEILGKVAKVLNVPVDAIKNMNDEAATTFINTFYGNYGHAHGHSNSINYNYNFNPIDKVVELYERLLAAEKEKTAMWEKLQAGKKGEI